MNLAEGAVVFLPMTIPDGTKVTNVVSLEDGVYPVGFHHPVMDTSVAVNFNTKKDDADTLVPVVEAGVAKAIAIAPAVAAYQPLIPAEWVGCKFLQLAVADNQTGAKVLYLAVRGV